MWKFSPLVFDDSAWKVDTYPTEDLPARIYSARQRLDNDFMPADLGMALMDLFDAFWRCGFRPSVPRPKVPGGDQDKWELLFLHWPFEHLKIEPVSEDPKTMVQVYDVNTYLKTFTVTDTAESFKAIVEFCYSKRRRSGTNLDAAIRHKNDRQLQPLSQEILDAFFGHGDCVNHPFIRDAKRHHKQGDMAQGILSLLKAFDCFQPELRQPENGATEWEIFFCKSPFRNILIRPMSRTNIDVLAHNRAREMFGFLESHVSIREMLQYIWDIGRDQQENWVSNLKKARENAKSSKAKKSKPPSLHRQIGRMAISKKRAQLDREKGQTSTQRGYLAARSNFAVESPSDGDSGRKDDSMANAPDPAREKTHMTYAEFIEAEKTMWD